MQGGVALVGVRGGEYGGAMIALRVSRGVAAVLGTLVAAACTGKGEVRGEAAATPVVAAPEVVAPEVAAEPPKGPSAAEVAAKAKPVQKDADVVPAVEDAPEEPLVGDPPRTPPKQPKAVSKPLAKEQLTALRAALEQKHGLAVRVRASLALPQANGEVLGFAVYDYGRFKECLLTASKADCRDRLGGSGDAPELIDSACLDTWLVRVGVATTLTIDDPVKLEYDDPPLASCKLTKVRRLAAADLDGDGSDEVLLDAFGSREGEGRVGPVLEAWRVFRVVRLDGTTQLDLDDAWFLHGEAQATDEALGRRIWFRDGDGDGNLDVEVEHRWLREPESVDAEDLWPEFGAEPEGPVTYAVWSYVKASDEWVAPPEPEEAAAPAEGEAAAAPAEPAADAAAPANATGAGEVPGGPEAAEAGGPAPAPLPTRPPLTPR